VNSGKWINSLSTVLQSEQWRWGAEEEGRREGHRKTHWAAPPGGAAGGSGGRSRQRFLLFSLLFICVSSVSVLLLLLLLLLLLSCFSFYFSPPQFGLRFPFFLSLFLRSLVLKTNPLSLCFSSSLLSRSLSFFFQSILFVLIVSPTRLVPFLYSVSLSKLLPTSPLPSSRLCSPIFPSSSFLFPFLVFSLLSLSLFIILLFLSFFPPPFPPCSSQPWKMPFGSLCFSFFFSLLSLYPSPVFFSTSQYL